MPAWQGLLPGGRPPCLPCSLPPGELPNATQLGEDPNLPPFEGNRNYTLASAAGPSGSAVSARAGRWADEDDTMGEEL